MSFSFLNAGSQVLSISFMKLPVCIIFVAVTWSVVSLSLIAWSYLAHISLMVRGFSCMTLLYLKTYIRYTDSNRRIWKSCVGPWCIVCLCWCWLFLHSLFVCRIMHPPPRTQIIPKEISGHRMFWCGPISPLQDTIWFGCSLSCTALVCGPLILFCCMFGITLCLHSWFLFIVLLAGAGIHVEFWWWWCLCCNHASPVVSLVFCYLFFHRRSLFMVCWVCVGFDIWCICI